MNSHEIERRLQALEGRFAYRGCDTCITWTGYLVVMIDGQTDEEISRSHPDVCPICGREIPVFRRLHVITGGYIAGG